MIIDDKEDGDVDFLTEDSVRLVEYMRVSLLVHCDRNNVGVVAEVPVDIDMVVVY